ncbi:uncharacterized protein LOC101855570 [Aplysia californica]|uniref:Uncharacterized protein LOC101855570 n=1 Tax=Aplysia californica TaxID=6500 RepID=A0ABM0JSP4_APLCA|nr:uncharacterized protein LOC101855570 [Aplysia californica]
MKVPVLCTCLLLVCVELACHFTEASPFRKPGKPSDVDEKAEHSALSPYGQKSMGVSISDVGPFTESPAFFFIDATLGSKKNTENTIRTLLGKFMDRDKTTGKYKTHLASNTLKNQNYKEGRASHTRKRRSVPDDDMVLVVRENKNDMTD